MKLIKLLSPQGKKLYFSIRILTGIRPKNISLYRLALTHKSVLERDENRQILSNDRLEYLGDAMLSAIIAQELYNKYPDGSEGFLTKTRSKIVNRTQLNDIAYSMGVADIIQTKLQTDPTKTHVLGDALEALIGAIFIDRGFEACRKFIIKEILDKHINIDNLTRKDSNYKSMLIEWSQKHKKNILFTTNEHHSTNEVSPVFISTVTIEDEKAGVGEGSSKKEAQQNAARIAMEKVRDNKASF
jgi:ribonuclease-3